MTDYFRSADILMVEDDPIDAELVQRALKRNNLADRLHVVEDGVAALDYLFCQGSYADRSRYAPPKVVLLDLKLPRLGGLEVLRQIKSDARTRTVPVVILTSSREDPDIRTAYVLGANSYVVKPVDFDSFTEAMGRLGLYWIAVNQPPAEDDTGGKGV